MLKHLRYFYGSFLITLVGIILALYFVNKPILQILYLILILIVLEVSLSFDNAVINAKVLEHMPKVWQKLFIYIGLPIAVFGMRLIFPIVLVKLSTNLSFSTVINTALHHPSQYQRALERGLPVISSFGCGFLIMVFFHFIFSNHPHQWIKFLENNYLIKSMAKIKGITLCASVVMGIILYLIAHINSLDVYPIISAYTIGVVIHEALHFTNHFVRRNLSGQSLRNGLLGFLYLETLDASFSFDGVIGAFAISTDIIIIMIGLGIGAMFVRSITIYFVEHKTLNRFLYLEHGAHYAIGFLAIVMFMKVFMHIPEWIPGIVSVSFITTSIIHSVKKQI